MARQLSVDRLRRFLLYAAGTGRGHATRLGALASELETLGVEAHLLLGEGGGPVARAVGAAPKRIYEVSGSAWQHQVQRALTRLTPSDCVVDTFPEGMVRELSPKRYPNVHWAALLRCRRDAHDRTFLAALGAYQQVYDLEPQLAWAPVGAIPFGSVIRAGLVPGSAKPLGADVLLLHTERRQQSFLTRLGERLKSAGVNVAEHPAPEVPRLAAPLLTAPELSVKVAVAPAGYNLTYELLALGVWHLALPAARQFDDQWLRATRLATVVRSPEAAERRVWAWLSQRAPRPPSQIRCMKDLAQVLCARGAGAAASR